MCLRSNILRHLTISYLGFRVETLFPELVQSAAGVNAAQGYYVLRACLAPEHARLFAARADHCVASSFHHARADKKALRPEGSRAQLIILAV
jgi:hypothetical protein